MHSIYCIIDAYVICKEGVSWISQWGFYMRSTESWVHLEFMITTKLYFYLIANKNDDVLYDLKRSVVYKSQRDKWNKHFVAWRYWEIINP